MFVCLLAGFLMAGSVVAQKTGNISGPFTLSGSLVPQNTGSISGTLTGDDGKPLPGVVIANGNGVAASGRAVSAANGAFIISNLPAGTYTLCGRPNGGGYLDPCSWSIDPPKVTVVSNHATANTPLVLAKGAMIQVQINDPSRILGATALSNTVAPHVLLAAVTPRGLIEPLVMTAKSATGINYQTTIPFSTPVAISIAGKQVHITDSAGNVLNPAGSSITVQQGPTGPATTVTLQVKP